MMKLFRTSTPIFVAILLLAVAGNSGADKPSPTRDPYRTVDLTVPNPYWGYTRNPSASTLDGLANLTRATGEYHERIQKAAKLREDNRQLKLTTRRAELEHMKWEDNFNHEWRQEVLERTIKDEERRARDHAPLTEILAGDSLNRIISGLQKDTTYPSSSRSEPLEQSWLDNVNFVVSGGHAGMLRQKQLDWPPLLQADCFTASREKIESLLEQARQNVRTGKRNGQLVKALRESINNLDEGATAEVTRKGSGWTTSDHTNAIRFLRVELRPAIVLLQNSAEAAFLLNYRPTCKTVAELIEHMRREGGLTFGHASPGSERFYSSLHGAVALEARKHEEKKRSKESSVK